MSVQGINKAKRELGFVLMALNIRKVTAQRAENNQKRQFLYYFNRNCLFYLSWNFMSQALSLYKKYLRQQMMSQVLNLSLKLFFNWE